MNITRPTLGVGMVGHAFMGAAHSQAWRTVNRVFDLPVTASMAVICGRDPAGVAQAADRLGVTQPAVSLQVRALEKRLGTQLLDRSGRRVAT